MICNTYHPNHSLLSPIYALLFCVLMLLVAGSAWADKAKKPNIIVVFVDDMGFQDLSSYGAPKIKTPHIDEMAKKGLRLTDFYVASPVCSASRASLLTGRLGIRNGTMGVYLPNSKGLNTEEVTLAEMLSGAGYSTAMYGKWHLGDLETSLPMAQGFGEYFGIPYSNDMTIGPNQTFAENAKFHDGYTLEKAKADQQLQKGKKAAELVALGLKEKVPLFEGNNIIEYPADQASSTKRFLIVQYNLSINRPQPRFLSI